MAKMRNILKLAYLSDSSGVDCCIVVLMSVSHRRRFQCWPHADFTDTSCWFRESRCVLLCLCVSAAKGEPVLCSAFCLHLSWLGFELGPRAAARITFSSFETSVKLRDIGTCLFRICDTISDVGSCLRTISDGRLSSLDWSSGKKEKPVSWALRGAGTVHSMQFSGPGRCSSAGLRLLPCRASSSVSRLLSCRTRSSVERRDKKEEVSHCWNFDRTAMIFYARGVRAEHHTKQWRWQNCPCRAPPDPLSPNLELENSALTKTWDSALKTLHNFRLTAVYFTNTQQSRWQNCQCWGSGVRDLESQIKQLLTTSRDVIVRKQWSWTSIRASCPSHS